MTKLDTYMLWEKDRTNRIMTDRHAEALDRDKFNQRLNYLKQASHASILTGTRQGWYEFTEKMIRGYVRLRAEQNGVVLEADHPTMRRRTKN